MVSCTYITTYLTYQEIIKFNLHRLKFIIFLYFLILDIIFKVSLDFLT